MDPCMGSLSAASSLAYNYRAMPPCLFGLNRRRFDHTFTVDNMLQVPTRTASTSHGRVLLPARPQPSVC